MNIINKFFLLRGVSGSGKSTVALQLLESSVAHCDGIFSVQEGAPTKMVVELSAKKSRITGVIHSTDNYFIDASGNYVFDRKKLGDYHTKNFESFCESVNDKIPVVIVDNTNTQRWEYQKYLDVAKNAGYLVAVVTLPHPSVEIAADRNKHGVPAEAIAKMIERWEK